jgi:uncharacterized protein YbbK (DUF523 family)
MQRILVSSCLLGEPVRYDGGHKRCDDPILLRWLQEGRIVPICPELAGGLSLPRPPAEITRGASGQDVLLGIASVMDQTGRDVSAPFIQGAERAVEAVVAMDIQLAVLKEGSPSCGTGFIHDGTFSGVKVSGAGVAAARLRQAGIRVFSEDQLAEADGFLTQCVSGKRA